MSTVPLSCHRVIAPRECQATPGYRECFRGYLRPPTLPDIFANLRRIWRSRSPQPSVRDTHRVRPVALRRTSGYSARHYALSPPKVTESVPVTFSLRFSHSVRPAAALRRTSGYSAGPCSGGSVLKNPLLRLLFCCWSFLRYDVPRPCRSNI